MHLHGNRTRNLMASSNVHSHLAVVAEFFNLDSSNNFFNFDSSNNFLILILVPSNLKFRKSSVKMVGQFYFF